MAKVTRENIAKLTDKLAVTLDKADYLGNFEVSLKKYAKTANIPGFRKGMVPAGLVKKMYGQSVFTDEILKTVEHELNNYLQAEQLDIFAQPLPLDSELRNMDINNPESYTFAFEIGLKPVVDIDIKKVKVTRYKINVTDQMLQDELERLQIRSGKMTEPEAVTGDDNVLNVKFVECDKSGTAIEGGIAKDNSLLVKYFEPTFRKTLTGKKNDDNVVLQVSKAFEAKEKEAILADLGLTDANADTYFSMQITKVGLVEKAEMNVEFFASVYPNAAIATAEEFTAEVKKEMEAYYDAQSRNQIHDQIYHHFVDQTPIELPEEFLKRWLQTGGEKPKTEEKAQADYPSFAGQLKWTLVSSKLAADNKIEVMPDDIRALAKQQLFSYMGGQMGALGDNQQWVEDYANRMMQDRKFVEDSYHRISTEKLFGIIETQVSAKEESISAEDFAKKLHNHQH